MPTATPATSTPAVEPRKHALTLPGCDPQVIGKTWVEALDNAIDRRDAQSILTAFASGATVEANVRGKGGEMARVELSRDQMAESTLAAISAMEDYRHRRVSIDAQLVTLKPPACDRIELKSVVIEQGRQAGKAFRFESLEEYLLELRDGKWLAAKAKTTQR